MTTAVRPTDLRLSAGFMDTVEGATWGMGDPFNGVGITNVLDIRILNQNFGYGVTSDPAGLYAGARGASLVPEPASLALVGAAGMLLGRRRR